MYGINNMKLNRVEEEQGMDGSGNKMAGMILRCMEDVTSILG